MAHEDERSLRKKPEINLAQLSKGGMIVGAEGNIKGPLMSLAGVAIERITRERAEVPPDQRLPENAVYFIDPDGKRLIMVSRRDGDPTWKRGLFAETVELDADGKPLFRLSTKEVPLAKDQYSMVAVGPNEFKMPPSHINMVEEQVPGQEKFVPWNFYLADLQTWMNEISIQPADTFETFMKRFDELRNRSDREVKSKIRTAFIGGTQGFDERVGPFNLIISDEVKKDSLMKASRDAGLFPLFVPIKEFIAMEETAPKENVYNVYNERRRRSGMAGDPKYDVAHFLPTRWRDGVKEFLPAIISFDITAAWRWRDAEGSFIEGIGDPTFRGPNIVGNILNNNPIFSCVELGVEDSLGPDKQSNGFYYCPNEEQTYREFLYKIKSDLLLTMFLRGGAPMIK